jgi:hypothetical protein
MWNLPFVSAGLGVLVFVGWAQAADAAARSTHVIIQNETTKTLVYVRGRVSHGEVTKKPPSRIPPGGTGDLFAESNGVMTGTEGEVFYRVEGVPGEARFYWDNPFVGSNTASASAPPGYVASYIGDKGNRTLAFYEIHQAGTAGVNCNPSWVLAHLGTNPEPSLTGFDRDSGAFTTPLKRLGFGGWVDTGCDAQATGVPVRTAQHSSDGFWTIDVRLTSMTINGQNAAASRFVRIEVEPETPAHAAAESHPPPGGVPIAFHGHVLIDTHHGDELVEVHPYDPIRFLASPSVGGSDTCKQGWVWREAFAGDHVCVTPQVRAQAADDNRLAASRRSPSGGPFGPDTCLQGFVWREASPSDHVCVLPATRAQAAADNGQAASRRV